MVVRRAGKWSGGRESGQGGWTVVKWERVQNSRPKMTEALMGGEAAGKLANMNNLTPENDRGINGRGSCLEAARPETLVVLLPVLVRSYPNLTPEPLYIISSCRHGR